MGPVHCPGEMLSSAFAWRGGGRHVPSLVRGPRSPFLDRLGKSQPGETINLGGGPRGSNRSEQIAQGSTARNLIGAHQLDRAGRVPPARLRHRARCSLAYARGQSLPNGDPWRGARTRPFTSEGGAARAEPRRGPAPRGYGGSPDEELEAPGLNRVSRPPSSAMTRHRGGGPVRPRPPTTRMDGGRRAAKRGPRNCVDEAVGPVGRTRPPATGLEEGEASHER